MPKIFFLVSTITRNRGQRGCHERVLCLSCVLLYQFYLYLWIVQPQNYFILQYNIVHQMIWEFRYQVNQVHTCWCFTPLKVLLSHPKSTPTWATKRCDLTYSGLASRPSGTAAVLGQLDVTTSRFHRFHLKPTETWYLKPYYEKLSIPFQSWWVERITCRPSSLHFFQRVGSQEAWPYLKKYGKIVP